MKSCELTIKLKSFVINLKDIISSLYCIKRQRPNTLIANHNMYYIFTYFVCMCLFCLFCFILTIFLLAANSSYTGLVVRNPDFVT